MKIEILNESLYAEYESFLLSQEYSLFYHSVKYKNFLEDLLDCESQYLLAYDQGKIIAALPLMIKNGPLGKIINSLPYYGSNGGVVGCKDNVVVEAFKSHIKTIDCSAITFISSPFEDSIFLDKITDQRYSQITFLKTHKNPEAYLLSVIDSSTRRNIKKAQRESIQIFIENELALDFLEQVHCENMSVIGGKAKKKDFFLKMSAYFIPNKDYQIICAKINGQTIAALLIFFYNKTVEYFTPVIKQEFRDKQPMALILFEAIKQAIKDGYFFWNWGGTWLTQDGVYQFKKKWGAREQIYNYSTTIFNKDIQNADVSIFSKEYEGFYVYNFNKELTDDKN